jgi:hypothetical protein
MADWYSVKGLFRWYFKSNGETDLIEERIVIFRARNFDHALDLAKRESKQYCAPDRKANFRIEAVGWWDARLLGVVGEAPAAGGEVYSRRCNTRLTAEAFVRRYYPKSHDAVAG